MMNQVLCIKYFIHSCIHFLHIHLHVRWTTEKKSVVRHSSLTDTCLFHRHNPHKPHQPISRLDPYVCVYNDVYIYFFANLENVDTYRTKKTEIK